MLKSLLFIGGGSFVGGCCRYLLSQLVGTRCVHAFPTSTFVVNVLGCFFIGLLFGLLEKYHHVDGRLGLFLLVG
ncbi:MAG: CrcB family protein, partial [Muribaculaceae bacterium]|nr:CrcB family protein [Muribaculaceae bacterium]